MQIMCKAPIATTLSPDTTRDDVFLSLRLLLQPHRWLKGKATEELEDAFKKRFLETASGIDFPQIAK